MEIRPIVLKLGLSLPVIATPNQEPISSPPVAQDSYEMGPPSPTEGESPVPAAAADIPPIEGERRVVKITDEMDLRPYVEDLGNPDPVKAYQAEAHLWNQFNWRGNEVMGLLLQAINHAPSLKAKVKAAIIIGERGEDLGGKVLESYFRDSKEDPAVIIATAIGVLSHDRWVNLNSFGEEKPPSHAEEVLKILSGYLAPEHPADLREFAAQGIFGFAGIPPEAGLVDLEFAMQYLSDPNPGVRGHAAYCIRENGIDAVNGVFPMLDLPHSLDATSGAVMVLAEFAASIPGLRGRESFGYEHWPLETAGKAIAKLIEFQDPAYGRIREDAQGALETLAQADFPTTFILDRLDPSQPLAVRIWSIRALAFRAKIIRLFENSRKDTLAEISAMKPEDLSDWEKDALIYYPKEEEDFGAMMEALARTRSEQTEPDADLRALAARAIEFIEQKPRSEWVEDDWASLLKGR